MPQTEHKLAIGLGLIVAVAAALFALHLAIDALSRRSGPPDYVGRVVIYLLAMCGAGCMLALVLSLAKRR